MLAIEQVSKLVETNRRSVSASAVLHESDKAIHLGPREWSVFVLFSSIHFSPLMASQNGFNFHGHFMLSFFWLINHVRHKGIALTPSSRIFRRRSSSATHSQNATSGARSSMSSNLSQSLCSSWSESFSYLLSSRVIGAELLCVGNESSAATALSDASLLRKWTDHLLGILHPNLRRSSGSCLRGVGGDRC